MVISDDMFGPNLTVFLKRCVNRYGHKQALQQMIVRLFTFQWSRVRSLVREVSYFCNAGQQPLVLSVSGHTISLKRSCSTWLDIVFEHG